MAVEIFVARHGQNEDNAMQILGGHRDKPLTDLGRAQARQLAVGIIDAGLSFDAVYCSPLIRAHETADIVAEIAGLPKPIVQDDLIERDFGVMTGVPVADIEKLTSDIMKIDDLTYFLSAEGVEEFPDVMKRAQKVLDDLRSRHSSGKILLVCHGDIGKMLYAVATDRDWKEVLGSFHLGNAKLIDIGNHHEAHVIKLEQSHH